ncbi:MAG: hypothetical protein J0L87_09855 [Bacteroidetes bacterium]|nr:hypothetical protein [Bacteroidota bacterium]
MKLFPKDIVSKIILLFIVAVIALSVRFIHQKNSYSPIDEYAHMDYIEKLTEGRLPRLSDQVSEELFLDVKNNPGRSLNGNITTREHLGIGNYSYEAIHPPVYYLTLLPVDLLLKKMEVPIFQRVKILRLCSYLIFVLGVFLLIPFFRSLSHLFNNIPDWYGYLGVFFCLFVASNHRYGLGNNMMSPLAINATAILLMKYLNLPSFKNAILFVLAGSLSVFVAIGNVFILPILFLVFAFHFWKNFSLKILLSSALLVLLFTILFWQWKYITQPDATINTNFQMILEMYIPAGLVDYSTFLRLFSEDAFRIAFLSENIDVTIVLLAFCFVSMIVGVIFIKTVWRNYKWAFCFAFALFVFFLTTFLLNRYVARIHWMALRHYLAFLPVFYVAISFGILFVVSKYLKRD